MTSLKLLKGFKNPISNESNTISMLLKSNLDLNDHIKSFRLKLLKALTCILENYGHNNYVCFHHKIVVAWSRSNDYLATRDYLIKMDNLEKNLNSSLKETIRMTRGKRVSHFVNVQIASNDDIDEVLELSKKEFMDLNTKITSAISIINDEYLFINDEDENASQKKVKQIKPKKFKKAINTEECLFIDSDDNEDENETDNETDVNKKWSVRTMVVNGFDETTCYNYGEPLLQIIGKSQCLFID